MRICYRKGTHCKHSVNESHIAPIKNQAKMAVIPQTLPIVKMTTNKKNLNRISTIRKS